MTRRAPAGLEVIAFADDERGIVVTETLLAGRTNYGHRQARHIDDLSEWMPIVGFPSHTLVVRTTLDGPGASIEKGIVSMDRLKAAVALAAAGSDEGTAWVEPDMRAHLNPTRMTAIRRLAFRLARRVATSCPSCATPGWGRIGFVDGLPCEVCDEPTTMVRAELFGCAACAHREERPRSDGLEQAPARRCPQCNP